MCGVEGSSGIMVWVEHLYSAPLASQKSVCFVWDPVRLLGMDSIDLPGHCGWACMSPVFRGLNSFNIISGILQWTHGEDTMDLHGAQCEAVQFVTHQRRF